MQKEDEEWYIYYHMLNVFIVNIFVDVCMDFFYEIKLLQ